MLKPRVSAFVIVASLAFCVAAFAHTDQAGMSAQQQQPAMPSQQAQPGMQVHQGPPPAAQDQPGAAQNGAMAAPTQSVATAVANRLAQALSLNDSQTTQVKNALEEERTQLLALRDDTKMSADQKQARLMDIRHTASTKIMSILTPDQQKKLSDLIQQQHQQQAQPAAPQPAQPPK